MSTRSEVRKALGDREEAIVPLPEPRKEIPRATAFRSTWIVSSIQSLQAAGHFERYRAALRPDSRDQILGCVAGEWLPMQVARAHYESCDALGLSKEEIVLLNRGAGSSIRKSWNAPFFSAVRNQNSPKWAALATVQRIWAVSMVGGAVGVFRLGEARGRVEYVGCDLFDIPYFRDAVRATLLGIVQHLGSRPIVRSLPQPARDECHYQVQWE